MTTYRINGSAEWIPSQLRTNCQIVPKKTIIQK